MKILWSVLLLLLAAASAGAQSIPNVKAKALDDSEVVLPKPGSQQVLILILGFSRKAGDMSEVWNKKVAEDFHADMRVAYYSLPVLQSAPSFVRPMILHGMRKGVPPQELLHFVPLYANEADWKKLVNFSSPDDAYLVVAAPDGHPVWQAHGPYSTALYAELRKALDTQLAKASAANPTH